MSRLQTIKNLFRRTPKSPLENDFAANTSDDAFQLDNSSSSEDTDFNVDSGKERKLFSFSKKNPTLNLQTSGLQSDKKLPYRLIGTLEELRELSFNPLPTKTTILLAGELILLSDVVVDTSENYSRQTDRIAKSVGNFTKRASPFTLKVWLHKNVLDLQRELKRHRFAFAIDQYLNYGKSQKNNFCLVTGCAGNNSTIIQFFTFERGALVAIDEKVLIDMQHSRFSTDFAELLNAKRKTGLSITITDPLPNPENDQYSYVGNSIYKKLVRYPIVDDLAQPSLIATNSIPVMIVLAAIFACAVAIITPYNQYNQATASFQRISASLPQDDLAFGSGQLKIMQERRFFLTETRSQQQTIQFLKKTAYVLSAENVTIKNIALRPEKQRPEDPDITITIQAKRVNNETALDQAKPLLDRISANLGVKLRLAHNAYLEQKTASGNTIQFNIEGNFKEKT